MKKVFAGVRLKRLREERNLTQQALASAIGISLSYLNQLENNQRPLTVPVLLKLGTAFDVNLQLFSQEDEARLLSDLRELASDPAIGETIAVAELRELASSMPAVGRVLASLHRRYGRTLDQLAALVARIGDDRQGNMTLPPSTAFEEVRDFFYTHHNHFAQLDEAAERIAQEMSMPIGQMSAAIAERLLRRHQIRVEIDSRLPTEMHRQFDPIARLLRLSAHLRQGQQAFQLATQLAFLEQGELIDDLTAAGIFTNSESQSLARIGLANHFAGALIMPYAAFLTATKHVRYDIELLGQRFGVGFETTCHRLSTLQRQAAHGIPFFFIRVDRAGNISKRQSATDFHFSRFGGTCPLWNIYEAFAQPEHILTQVASMPDGRTYLWIARCVSRGQGGYHAPRKTFSVALGCDIRHAPQLVYADGLDLGNPAAATPIGAGCKICERPACPQRAFPPIGQHPNADQNRSAFAPYAAIR